MVDFFALLAGVTGLFAAVLLVEDVLLCFLSLAPFPRTISLLVVFATVTVAVLVSVFVSPSPNVRVCFGGDVVPGSLVLRTFARWM